LVAEADESDASFTHLQPLIAVVTNIDNDHLSTHGGDFGLLKQSFADFLHNLPFYGLAVLCADDPHTASIVEEVGRPILFYGLSPGADVRGTNLRPAGLKTRFEVARRDSGPLEVQLNLPGTHNVANALAAIAVTTELGIDDRAILNALATFQGIDRRLQHIADVPTAVGRVTIVDDYAHHPTEVAVTLDAVRQAYPGRRVLLAFQPHRYTRTRDLIDDFGKVLSGADALAVAPEFRERVRRDEPLSRHTSWHVGGPAEVFFNPRDRVELAEFLRSLPPAVPIHWIGLGSNLLVRDGGLKGVVVSTQGALDL